MEHLSIMTYHRRAGHHTAAANRRTAVLTDLMHFYRERATARALSFRFHPYTVDTIDHCMMKEQARKRARRAASIGWCAMARSTPGMWH